MSPFVIIVGNYVKEGFETYQTLSLDTEALGIIKISLLDRFLACMKPASITLPRLAPGFFLVLNLVKHQYLLGFQAITTCFERRFNIIRANRLSGNRLGIVFRIAIPLGHGVNKFALASSGYWDRSIMAGG